MACCFLVSPVDFSCVASLLLPETAMWNATEQDPGLTVQIPRTPPLRPSEKLDPQYCDPCTRLWYLSCDAGNRKSGCKMGGWECLRAQRSRHTRLGGQLSCVT